MNATHHTDILILGAGPAGATAALFLAKQGVNSLLVDKAKFPRDKICGDALSGKVVEVLNKLNPELVNELYSNSKFLGSWGVTFVAPNEQALRVPFITKKEKVKAPGFIATRLDFDNWLLEKTKRQSAIQLLEETELRKFTKTENGWLAEAKNGMTISAKLILACDGAYSTFSRQAGGLITEPQHNCFGLRAYFENVKDLDHENFIELHFLNDFLPGYFWIFPLPNGGANVGVGMRADKMTKKKINLKKSFEEIIASYNTIAPRFAEAKQIGEIKQYGLPLGSKRRKLSGDSYLLCGDAAQLIDPFTGEGIGNAMMSGMIAAQQAAKCVANNNFTEGYIAEYDQRLYHRLWSELQLSYRMQQLVNYPSLFNFVVKKANSNPILRETISCMFEDLDMRARLKDPRFYFKLLFSPSK